MNIGIDFDDTWTRDPLMWKKIVEAMRNRGHKVYMVTWRTPEESDALFALGCTFDGIYPTSRKAKEKFMYAQGIRIDVWIDDNPSAILHDMKE